jgi:hypothetical protein
VRLLNPPDPIELEFNLVSITFNLGLSKNCFNFPIIRDGITCTHVRKEDWMESSCLLVIDLSCE